MLYISPSQSPGNAGEVAYRSIEVPLGRELDKSSFFRKVNSWGIIEEVPGALEESKGHKRAQLYRIKPGRTIELFQRLPRLTIEESACG